MTSKGLESLEGSFFHHEGLGLSLDTSGMGASLTAADELHERLEAARREMVALEAGALANPDEGRQVGHYWLRAPELAPSAEIRRTIETTRDAVATFAAGVLAGRVASRSGPFQRILSLGIGGSALGPQLVAEALAPAVPPLSIDFLDNTDPDGFDRAFARIGSLWDRTLILVISKSGGTAETANALVEVRARLAAAGLDLAERAVAITGPGSRLDELARTGNWLARFPMWDFVGGRTSQFSAVGLLPAALQGIDIAGLLEGARVMDRWTREAPVLENPAARLAHAWLVGSGGHGSNAMVVLPYKDRLSLLARYLQQLVMESLGKELDRQGRRVEQGLTVFGNKGSTDQHAYVQQLRDGTPNFFVGFVEVRQGRSGTGPEVEPGITAGDYLNGFLQGTRQALGEKGRRSFTLSIPEVTPMTLGALIALFERTVGLYASLIDVNAYHQPGVEAGKRAATAVLRLLGAVRTALASLGEVTAPELARTLPGADEVTVFHLLRHLAANDPSVSVVDRGSPRTWRFRRDPRWRGDQPPGASSRP